MILFLLILVAQASPPTPTAPSAATPSTAALNFAQRYVPLEATTANAERAFRAAAQKPSVDGDAMFAQIERKYPGAKQKLIDAGAAAVAAQYRSGLPAIHRRLATVAATQLSASDLNQIAAFLASPTGRATQNAVAGNIDTQTFEKSAKNGTPITAEQMMGSIDLVGSMRALSPAQIAEIARFAATPAGMRFRSVQPSLQLVLAEETNALVRSSNEAVQKATMMAMRSMATSAKGK